MTTASSCIGHGFLHVRVEQSHAAFGTLGVVGGLFSSRLVVCCFVLVGWVSFVFGLGFAFVLLRLGFSFRFRSFCVCVAFRVFVALVRTCAENEMSCLCDMIHLNFKTSVLSESGKF